MKYLRILFSFLTLSLLFACKPDPVTPPDPIYPPVDTTTVDTVVLTKAMLIINEGTFTYANSSLTYYNIDQDSVVNYVFSNANDGAVIGDTGESLTLLDGKLYIVVNNSNYIYKVDINTFKCDMSQTYQIAGFSSPRYMLPVSSTKAYVSNINGIDLNIINPQTLTHVGTIPMGKSTECMLRVEDELYVTNWSRFYVNGMVNNTVQVVDLNNDIKVADIEVGFEPNCIVKDKNDKVWVMCEGDVNDLSVPSTLWKIDPSTKDATLVKTFDKKALSLAIDPTGTFLYFVYGGDWTNGGDVRRINVDSPSEMDSFVISGADKLFYKIAVDPWDGDIYLTDAKNYTVDGAVYRYSSDGTLITSFDAGICPGNMLFY